MKYTQPLLSFLREPALPLNGVSHFSLYFFQFENFVQALVKKIDAIIDKEVQKI
jgi:hypothetical protein